MQKIYFVSLALNKTDTYRAAKDRIKKKRTILWCAFNFKA